jgi:hypothetical protein
MDTAAYFGRLGYTYPYPVDSSLLMCPVRAGEVSFPRGTLPGIWAPLHTKPLTHLDTFEGSGTLAGKTFLVLNGYDTAQMFIETSNTWDI